MHQQFSSMNIIISICFVLCLSIGISSQTNLIKESDFQQYRLDLIYDTSFSFQYANVQSSNWYVQNNGHQIQVKKIPSSKTSICAQLTTTIPITLCQNVSLQVGSKYILSYSTFSNMFTNMVFYVYINDQLVSSFLTPFQYKLGYSTYTLFAKTDNVKICFNQLHQNSTLTYYQDYGGLIDNITLILVERQVVSCQYFIDQIQQSIKFYGNISYSEGIGQKIQNSVQLYLETHPLQLKTNKTEDGYLFIQVNYNFDFYLGTFQAFDMSKYNETKFQFVLSNYQNKKYYNLEGLDLVLKVPSTFVCYTGMIIGKLLTWSRVFLVSFFIAIIVDNQYLTLFYVFLQPKTMPEFAKNVYYQALNVLSGQSELQFTLDILNQNSPTFSIENIPQNIQQTKNDQPWFGSFGFSSKLIQGNLSNIYSLLLLIIKNLIFRALFRLFAPACVKRVLYGKPSKLGELLLTEFVFMSPKIIPGLLMNIMTPTTRTKEYFYKASSALFLFIIIGTFIHYIISTTSYKKIYKPAKVPTYEIKFQQDIMVFAKLFFLPFAIIGSQSSFLVLVGAAIISELVITLVLLWIGTNRKKMFLYLLGICGWIIHHICFILFCFGVESVYLGLLSLFSPMCIILIEIFKLFYKIYQFYISTRIFYKKVKKQQKMLEKRQQQIEKQKAERQTNKKQIQQEEQKRRIKIQQQNTRSQRFWNWLHKKREQGLRAIKERNRKLRQKQQQEERNKKRKEDQKQEKNLENPTFFKKVSTFIKGIGKSHKIKDKITVEQIQEGPEEIEYAPRREIIRQIPVQIIKKGVSKEKTKEKSPGQVQKPERRIIIDPHIDLRQQNAIKRAKYPVYLLEPADIQQEAPKQKSPQAQKTKKERKKSMNKLKKIKKVEQNTEST